MEAEAKEIGIQLQSLLNIPPIQKSRSPNESIEHSTIPLPQDWTSMSHNNHDFKHMDLENFENHVHISNSLVFENRNLAKPETNWRNHVETNQEPDGSFQTNHDKRILIQSPACDTRLNKSIEIAQDISTRTMNMTALPQKFETRIFPKIQETILPSHTMPGNESIAETRRNYLLKEPPVAFSKSRAKLVSQINELVRNENCPRNVVMMKDKLIEAYLDEQKVTHYLKLNSEVLELFKLQSIEPLAKKSTKFARAKYFCSICNYHLDTVINVISHVSNTRHITNSKMRNLDHELENIPTPSEEHQKNLHYLVLEIMNAQGIDEAERNLRFRVLEKLNKELAPHKIQLELFGSSVPGFGFKSSNINFNFDLNKRRDEETNESLTNTEHAAVVTELTKILQTFPFVKDTIEGQHVLQIKFTDTDVSRNCCIQVNNVSGTLLSKLFLEYDKLDWRVRPLVVAFRFWARVVEIDDQEVDLLPGHAYTIMVLKHLLDVAVIPYIIEPSDSVSFRSFLESTEESSSTWKSLNNQNLGLLWLGLLRKYSLEFPMKELVVSLVQPDLLRSSDRMWNKKLSIEDPIIPKSNLSRSASSNRVCEYIFDKIKISYKYFGIPRMMGNVPLYDAVFPLAMVKNAERIYSFRKPKPIAVVAPIQTKSHDCTHLRKAYEELQIHEKSIITPPEDWSGAERIRLINLPDYMGDTRVYVIKEDLLRIHNVLLAADYNYKFVKENFQGGEEPPKHCKSCGGDGHTRRNCPDDIVPGLAPVSYPDETTLNVLNNVMRQVYDDNALLDINVQERHLLIYDIYRCLVDCYPDVELIIFGSTSNGFGLRGSDVDICVRFKKNPICKADFRSEQVAKRLKVVVDRLKSSGCMAELLAIPSAKVPIVKFKHRVTKLEGDISFSNELALRNTQLLRSYVEIDKRVQVLGCFLKQLTKLCDISDASKGSLSSYGYVLMLIHFLQQRNPPVLPVLQQIPDENRPEHLVEGWDCYFYRDIDPSTLSQNWKGFRSNNESVGQLFLAFIKYYTETFDFETRVVTISQLEPLSRKQKLWTTSTLICIEDPFETCHNLGAGLTRRMSVFIVKTLQKFREVFFKSLWKYLPHIDYVSMFLDPVLIRGTMNPPIDRQCRNCNRIGHFANNCNYKTRNGDTSPDGAEADVDGDFDFLSHPRRTTDPEFLERNLTYPGLENRQLHNYGQSPVVQQFRHSGTAASTKEQNVNRTSPELHNSTNINNPGRVFQQQGPTTRHQIHEFQLENFREMHASNVGRNYQATPPLFPTPPPGFSTTPGISNPTSSCPPPGFEFLPLKNNNAITSFHPSPFAHIPERTVFPSTVPPPRPLLAPHDFRKFMQPNPVVPFEKSKDVSLDRFYRQAQTENW